MAEVTVDVFHKSKDQELRLKLFRELAEKHARLDWRKIAVKMRKTYRFAPSSTSCSKIWHEVHDELEKAKPAKLPPKKARRAVVKAGGVSESAFESLATRQANALERVAAALEALLMDKLTTPTEPLNGARICETTDESAS